jgi:P-type Ca2+ transporter type 2C
MACIQKAIQYQISVIFVVTVMILLGSAFLHESPLVPVQILWISLINDVLAVLALATEPASSNLLVKKPHLQRENIITKEMWVFIIT